MPKIVKIGRASDNDFVINDPTVSRHHAQLTIADDCQHAILKDLGSANGTYVDDVRIQEPFNINLHHRLRFGTAVCTLSQLIPGPPVPPPNLRTIGRGNRCHIRLAFDDVSTSHALLTRRDDGSVYIEDTNSTNGTYVNGERLTGGRVLRKGDKVTITPFHPLDWEAIFPPKSSILSLDKGLLFAGMGLSVLLLLLVIFFWRMRAWNQERIYNEYNTAVCFVHIQYGYKVYIDGSDRTADLCPFLKLPKSNYLHVSSERRLDTAQISTSGTAFFISEDGKLATNLHIARPWQTDPRDAEYIERRVNAVLSRMPDFTRSKVEIKGEIEHYIIPNGLPVSQENLRRCQVIRTSDDTNIDIAVLQTDSRTLPVEVKRIIDISKADVSEKSIRVGKTVFLIGFPYGVKFETGLASNQDLQNQVHRGSVTQNRGDYAFGHDAATAGGASGSPVFNDRGRLVGIHYGGLTGVTGAQGFNRAIKAKYIQELLDK